jgi:branched-chain amino acid aminotransferase
MVLSHGFHNNRIAPLSEISIGPNNLSLHRGYGIFDYFTYHNRSNHHLDWYLDRFYSSADKANLVIHHSRQEIIDIINQLYDLNDTPNSNIKIILSGGDSANGYTPTDKPDLLILNYKHTPPPTAHYTQGIKLLTHRYVRPMADIKSTNYIIPYLMRPKLEQAAALDVLYMMDGIISESSRANIFCYRDHTLYTPSRDILPGITRRILIEEQVLYPVVLKDIKLDELLASDEVFITSSTKKVLPVVKIDDHSINGGNVGPISARLNQWMTTRTSC